ncbi:MAG: carboxypeptidase-like regulatory domain-containing protein [Candidatus Aminicenantales bacterium]
MKTASSRIGMIGLASIMVLGALLDVPAATDSPQTPAPASRARIFGHVRDFNGKPIEGADIELKAARFENAAATRSAADGSYSLTVEAGMYIALAAVKDYQVSKLEYWAWNVPAFGEVEIDPRFDRLEVYGLNAWRPQGGFPSYQIYFRPMSLTMTVAAVTKAGGMDKLGGLSFIDIAPDLKAKDIAVKIDGESVEVLRVNKVQEASSPTQALYGFLIQTPLPKVQGTGDWITVDVTLSDPATGEKGEGRLYLARPRYTQGAAPAAKPPR